MKTQQRMGCEGRGKKEGGVPGTSYPFDVPRGFVDLLNVRHCR
jgi:hypothetical protein